MTDPLEVKKRKCDYFIPRKQSHSDVKISDHAVAQYVARFNHKGNGNGNAPVRKILKSILDNGEVIKERDENNRVIRHNNVYCIVKNGVLATVYLEKMYYERCASIEKNWGCGSNEE